MIFFSKIYLNSKSKVCFFLLIWYFPLLAMEIDEQEKIYLDSDEIGYCEDEKHKTFNREMIVKIGKIKNLKPTVEELYSGKVFLFHKIFYKEKSFKNFFVMAPDLLRRNIFKKGLFVGSLSIFAVDAIEEEYFSVEKQLDKKFIEKMARKVTVFGSIVDSEVGGIKEITHHVPLLPKLNFKLKIRAASYDYEKQLWSGHKKCQLEIDQIDLMLSKYLSGVQNIEKKAIVSVQIDGLGSLLKGTQFLTMFYNDPISDKTIVAIWQIVAFDFTKILRIAIKLVPKLVENVLTRDMAKLVDAYRLLSR